nr:MAG TPA: hypothetical protein [Bacteriophage sp.]
MNLCRCASAYCECQATDTLLYLLDKYRWCQKLHGFTWG